MSMIPILLAFCALVILLSNGKEALRKRILVPGICIGLLGGVPNAYITRQFYPNASASYIALVFIYTVFASAGLYLAERAGLPQLWSREPIHKWKQLLLAGGLGILLGLIVYGVSSPTTPEECTGAWAVFATNMKSHPNALLITIIASVQAGLTEEPIFRLFLIPAGVMLVTQFVKKPKWLPLAIVVVGTSAAFGLIPTHNFILATIIGIAMSVGYLKLGLIPIIVCHIVADLVNLPLMFGLW